jgi:hypothetical protein
MLKLDIQRFADERPYYTSGVLIDEEALYEYHDKMKTYLANNIPEVGNSKVYYGTSDTGASTQAKVVVSSDYVLEEGNTIFVKFTNAQTYNGTATLNVNSTGAKNITRVGTTTTSRYWWTAGEVVGFVYDGTNYVMIDKGAATTSYYGLTKLSSAINSTSTSLAATPSAVKQAYDLANGKQDEITSSNKLDYSLISNTPTIPENTSDLTNDSGFITSSYHDSTKQDSLVSGTNIKTINNQSLLGSGNINISSGGGGTATDVQINGSSIVSNDVANILVDGTYSSSNKIATMSSLPTVPTATSELTNDGDGFLNYKYAVAREDGTGIQVERMSNLRWWVGAIHNYTNACRLATEEDIGDLTQLTTTNQDSLVEAINELVNLKPVVLYNDATGTNNNVALSDSSDNYTYIEIFFRNNNNAYNSVKIYQPNGKAVSLSADYCNNNVNPKLNYHSVRIVSISGSQISTLASSRYIEVCERSASAYIQMSNNNNIYITRVLGYK